MEIIMAVLYGFIASLIAVWLAGMVIKDRGVGSGGDVHKQSMRLPVGLTVAAVFLASCAGSQSASPAVAPVANSTATGSVAGSTPKSTSSGPGAGSITYNVVPGKTQAQYSVREQLTLTGYVITTDCTPVAHALLDFWQANAQGEYDNNGDKRQATFNFIITP